MTRQTSFRALFLALILASALPSAPLFAQAGIGIDEALAIVRANGMVIVAKLEHEDEKGKSIWEAEGFDANRKKMEMEIDAFTGKILLRK